MVKVTALSEEYKSDLIKMVDTYEGSDQAKLLEKQIASLTDEQEILVCIDVETNKVIGYSKTTALLHAILQLDYIYVIPTLRRDTNGSIILVAVYNRAINRMTAGIIAECNENNEVGNAFLKSRGFILGKTENQVNFYTKSLMHMYIPHNHDD